MDKIPNKTFGNFFFGNWGICADKVLGAITLIPFPWYIALKTSDKKYCTHKIHISF